jgi:hypothetical protein
MTKPSLPKPPSDLSAASKRWWRGVIEEFVVPDWALRGLTAAARAWDRAEQARLALDEHGLTFDDANGKPRPRPEVRIELDSRTSYLRCVRELALDVEPPSSRPPRRPGTGR